MCLENKVIKSKLSGSIAEILTKSNRVDRTSTTSSQQVVVVYSFEICLTDARVLLSSQLVHEAAVFCIATVARGFSRRRVYCTRPAQVHALLLPCNKLNCHSSSCVHTCCLFSCESGENAVEIGRFMRPSAVRGRILTADSAASRLGSSRSAQQSLGLREGNPTLPGGISQGPCRLSFSAALVAEEHLDGFEFGLRVVLSSPPRVKRALLINLANCAAPAGIEVSVAALI